MHGDQSVIIINASVILNHQFMMVHGCLFPCAELREEANISVLDEYASINIGGLVSDDATRSKLYQWLNF